MKALITNIISHDEISEASDMLKKALSILSPKAIPIDMKIRQERRKMGTARQGYVNMVLPIAINNIHLLPRDLEPAYLDQIMGLLKEVATMRGLAQKMLELTDDTWMGMGIDAVALSDAFVGSFQTARKRDDSLDTEMGEIDEYNSRFANQMVEEDKNPAPVVTAAEPVVS